MVNFRTQGFLKGKRETQGQTHEPKHLINIFVGKRLDEIQVDAIIKTTEEMEDLIKFLINSKPCLDNK